MPTYLAHGFRWSRNKIIVWVATHRVDDAAGGWVIGPATSNAILNKFYDLFDYLPSYETPKASDSNDPNEECGRTSSDSNQLLPPSQDLVLANEWSAVKLLEEYDPLDESAAWAPHAFVADYAVRVDSSVSIADEMKAYQELVEKRAGHEWFEKFRNAMEPSAEIQWFIVVCGDEERDWPRDLDSADEDEEEEEEEEVPVAEGSVAKDSQATKTTPRLSLPAEEEGKGKKKASASRSPIERLSHSSLANTFRELKLTRHKNHGKGEKSPE